MAEESRMAVVDRTFDAMVIVKILRVFFVANRWRATGLSHCTYLLQVQQTITNTSGYKMSKKDLYLLCPEISPESRR
jgi:hypothetical protein